jgi:hypothetical protein
MKSSKSEVRNPGIDPLPQDHVEPFTEAPYVTPTTLAIIIKNPNPYLWKRYQRPGTRKISVQYIPVVQAQQR